MNKKLTVILSLVVLSCLLHTRYNLVEIKAPNGYPVHNLNTGLNYTTIQGAVDAPETVNGNTIFVQSGVYYEKVLVDKGISLIGQDRDRTIIDGNSSEGGVHIACDNAMLSNFTVRNCRNHGINSAIYLDHADYCEVMGNVVANSSGGILLSYSTASNISGNLIDRNDFAFGVFGRELGEFMHSIDTSNLVNGKSIYYLINQSDLVVNPLTFPSAGYLALVNSKNVVVENLTLTNNWQGLLLAYVNHARIVGNRVLDSGVGMVISQSLNSSVLNNVASSNGHGIGVVGSGISLDHSQGNTIATNLVTGNYIGINPAWSSNNSICHNNIMGNTKQIYAYSSMDLWNNDYLSGGNYWSDYNGTDLNHDGIGDTPYIIDANNTDNYPLMGMFSDFNATSEQRVQTICNSTISDFRFNGTAIIFNVSGENDTTGFCRMCIPTFLINDPLKVFVNKTEFSCNLLPCSNMTHSYVCFNYSLGENRNHVLLKTTMGDIVIELYDDMPITANNFRRLVEERIYNGTIFHRVIDGFVIQGGDPTGTGYGDPSIPTIPDEFTDHNRNDRGTIAMANRGPNTGNSQFFINLVNNNYLDTKHPVFGRVIKGIDVVDTIGKVPTDSNDRPLQEVKIISAQFVKYENAILEVTIISEFPSSLILPLFTTATLLVVIVYRRKHTTYRSIVE